MKKTFLGIVVALMLLATALGAVAFPHSKLGSAGVTPSDDDGIAFTAVGQKRGCSEYPDETKVFYEQAYLTCKNEPALVNIYHCVNDDPNCASGYKYVGEYETKTLFADASDKSYFVYECYYCSATRECPVDGKKACVTETSSAMCKNGKFDSSRTYCDSGDYCNEDTGSCKSYSCHESWSCGSWGTCNSKGFKYRTCSDKNKCGTFSDMPVQAQKCTPPKPVVTTTSKFIGTPTISKTLAKPGESFTITQQFVAAKEGTYMLEAGIEKIGGLAASIASIRSNACHPSEKHYANKQIKLSKGTHTVTFTVTPVNGEGTYKYHTAYVTGCGGKVIQQVNSDTKVKVAKSDTSTSFSWILTYWYVLLGIAAVLVGAFLIFRGGKK